MVRNLPVRGNKTDCTGSPGVTSSGTCRHYEIFSYMDFGLLIQELCSNYQTCISWLVREKRRNHEFCICIALNEIEGHTVGQE